MHFVLVAEYHKAISGLAGLNSKGFEAFEEAGPTSSIWWWPGWLHDFVYSAGGSRDYEAADIQAFRGRMPSPAALASFANAAFKPAKAETARKAKAGDGAVFFEIGWKKISPKIFHDPHRRRRRICPRRPHREPHGLWRDAARRGPPKYRQAALAVLLGAVGS